MSASSQHSRSVAEVRELVHQHSKRSWWANAVSDEGVPLGDYPAGAYNEGLAAVNAAFDSIEEQLQSAHQQLTAGRREEAALRTEYLGLQEQLETLREALLTVAKDAHGPGYPDEHSFNGGPVKMHGHTLMMVDEALGSNPASEPTT